jgi:hypothetical protein
MIAALFPLFVAALAVVAFANGFWMSVGGYFLRTDQYVELSQMRGN